MKFFVSAAAAATLFATLASAYNGFAGPAEGEIIPAGKPYLIKWEADTEGPVYITLRKGARTDLDTLYQIVMLEYNWGNYTWDVPADTPAGKDYAFEMKWGKEPRPEDVNYTGLFEITSGDDVKQEDTKSSTTTESAAETKTATESATETKTASATETDSASESSAPTSTEKDTSATETSTATGKKTSTGTKTSSGPTVTPSVKDEDSSAGVLGASAGMAAAVAFAAVAFL